MVVTLLGLELVSLPEDKVTQKAGEVKGNLAACDSREREADLDRDRLLPRLKIEH
jgi:hypothetical protein